MNGYRCTGCGEHDSIVEVSLVPRTVAVTPTGDTVAEDEVDYGRDDACWEGETVLGYGCSNVDCEYWQGNYGISRDAHDTFIVVVAPPLDEVARLVPAVAA